VPNRYSILALYTQAVFAPDFLISDMDGNSHFLISVDLQKGGMSDLELKQECLEPWKENTRNARIPGTEKKEPKLNP
jgi:hypothetical protein